MPNNFQYIKLIIILLFVGFSVASFLYRKFKEQQQQQQAKLDALRRREQMLRTGRVEQDESFPQPGSIEPPPQQQPRPETPHDEARRRLQELAAQRRRELEAMTRRAAGGPPTQAPSPPPVSRPFPARPIATRTTPPRSPVPPRQTGNPNNAAEQARRQAQKAAKAEEARNRAERERQARDERARATQALAADSASQPSAEPSPSSLSSPTGAIRILAAGVPVGSRRPEDWRRAIVMMELLAPPAGLRDDQARVF